MTGRGEPGEREDTRVFLRGTARAPRPVRPLTPGQLAWPPPVPVAALGSGDREGTPSSLDADTQRGLVILSHGSPGGSTS